MPAGITYLSNIEIFRENINCGVIFSRDVSCEILHKRDSSLSVYDLFVWTPTVISSMRTPPYHIETSLLIYFANRWTSFYMIGIQVMKELKG